MIWQIELPERSMARCLGDCKGPEITWIRLMRIGRRLSRVTERRLRQVGLPPLAWHDALVLLASQPNGEMSSRDLEREISMRQYQVSRLVDGLVESRLVTRRRLGRIGRPLVVSLTQSGRDLQAKMAEVYHSVVDREILGDFSQQEADELVSLLAGVLRTSQSSVLPHRRFVAANS